MTTPTPKLMSELAAVDWRMTEGATTDNINSAMLRRIAIAVERVAAATESVDRRLRDEEANWACAARTTVGFVLRRHRHAAERIGAVRTYRWMANRIAWLHSDWPGGGAAFCTELRLRPWEYINLDEPWEGDTFYVPSPTKARWRRICEEARKRP